jgi:outer membrane protein assembly factor BamB
MEVFAPLVASDGTVYVHARTSNRDALYAIDIEARAVGWSYGLVDD